MSERDGREVARKREWNKLHHKLRHKPSHTILPSERPRCPICNQPAYSRFGVHPQCQAYQAEKERSGVDPVTLRGETSTETG